MITEKKIKSGYNRREIEAQVSRVGFCTGRGQPQKRKGETAEGRVSAREFFLEYGRIYRILSPKVERYPFFSGLCQGKRYRKRIYADHERIHFGAAHGFLFRRILQGACRRIRYKKG